MRGGKSPRVAQKGEKEKNGKHLDWSENPASRIFSVVGVDHIMIVKRIRKKGFPNELGTRREGL